MKRRASLHNLGCKVNAYETEAMEQMLREAGYEIVSEDEPADVCIINTCSVTNVADKKSRQMLHRARTKNPGAVVVAAGCYVQAAARELEKDPAVDIIIGNNRKKELIAILEERVQRQESSAETYLLDIGAEKVYEDLPVRKASQHTRAFIKVQDGCNQFCSYCIIPYTRGRVRSRRMDSVLGEAKALAAAGYREVVLTGIHLSSYGTEGAGQPTLLQLLQLLHEVEGLERIRLGSLEPRIVTREFAEALRRLPKICPHFHLSLQSGCAETLRRMNRHYTPEEYEKSCRYLREAYDLPAITTDVIVGFPGETEEEFRQTREFLRQVHFYEMHIFKYSRRKGTRAAQMEGQIEESLKSRRSEELFALEAEMSGEYRRSFLGKTNQLLLEEELFIDGKPYMSGYTREYVRGLVSLEALNRLYRGGEEAAVSEMDDRSFWKGRLIQGVGTRMVTPEMMEFLPELRKI